MPSDTLAAAEKPNAGTDKDVGFSRQVCRSFGPVMRVARGLWRSKVPDELAAITGRSRRTCERWLTGDVDPDGEATFALLLSAKGPNFYAAKITELPLARQKALWAELHRASKRHLLLIERGETDAKLAALTD